MSVNVTAMLGAAIWVACLAAQTPHPATVDWLRAVLLLAALVLVPLALPIFAEDSEAESATKSFARAQRIHVAAVLFLTAALLLPPGPVAALLTLPWLGFTVFLAWIGFTRLRRGGLQRSLAGMCADVALIYAAVGGAWTLADRAGFAPLGFDVVIVALTAVHFHFAGLLLPLFAGRVQQELWFSRFAARAAVGAVLGVPAVAVGISATQLGWGPSLEAAAGGGLALAGMAVGILHVRIALEARRPVLTRVWLGVAGVSLFSSMVFAALYAIRAFALPFPWLGLPQMQMLHGSLNAFGFGLAGILGWRAMKPR